MIISSFKNLSSGIIDIRFLCVTKILEGGTYDSANASGGMICGFDRRFALQ